MNEMHPTASGMRPVCGYDLDSNMVRIPDHIWELSKSKQLAWFKKNRIIPPVQGAAYSMFEMMQPWGMQADAPAITAAAEAIISQATTLTVPSNYFAYPNKVCWLHAHGILSSPVTTPGTFTFRLRWGTGVVGDVLLMASGALAPDIAVHTNAMFWIDCWIKCLAQGALATSLSVQVHGKVNLSSSDVTLAAQQAQFMPAGNAAQANITGLDGTIAKTLTITAQPSLTTGSVSLRDAWVVSMN
jgi:hypothetical protein